MFCISYDHSKYSFVNVFLILIITMYKYPFTNFIPVEYEKLFKKGGAYVYI